MPPWLLDLAQVRLVLSQCLWRPDRKHHTWRRGHNKALPFDSLLQYRKPCSSRGSGRCTEAGKSHLTGAGWTGPGLGLWGMSLFLSLSLPCSDWCKWLRRKALVGGAAAVSKTKDGTITNIIIIIIVSAPCVRITGWQSSSLVWALARAGAHRGGGRVPRTAEGGFRVLGDSCENDDKKAAARVVALGLQSGLRLSPHSLLRMGPSLRA